MTRPAAILLLGLAVPACTCQRAPDPVVVRVVPGEVSNDVDQWLSIQGDHFEPLVKADLDAPWLSPVDARFGVEVFRATGAPVSLPDVALVSSTEIQARLPAGAPGGTYGIAVIDPRGGRGALDRALSVFAPCAPDGSSCRDGDRCTRDDVCVGGRCSPGTPVVCTASGQCHVAGVCDPWTGQCSNPPAQDGTPCRLQCAGGEICQAASCVPPPEGCPPVSPPLARLTVSPTAGTTTTTFSFDASGSTDPEDPLGSLSARFDLEGTGLFSTPGPASQPVTHLYAQPGIFQAAVQVTDPSGLSAHAWALVPVIADGDLVEVTTALDEDDAGATPASPGGTGLSLREAIVWVNLQATPKIVTFAAFLSGTIAMAPPPARPLTLSATGTAVVGRPDVTVDFGGNDQPCLKLTGTNQLLLGLNLTGCANTFVQMQPSGQGSRVAWCTIGPGATALGIDAQAPTGASAASVTGPGNHLSGLAAGVLVSGTDHVVAGNRVHANALGIVVQGVRSLVAGNAVFSQAAVGPNTGTGLRILGGAGPVTVWNNVFDGNGGDGLQADAVPLDVRNNLFTDNSGYGVRAQSGSFAPGGFDHNGFFANGLGAVESGLATGATDVLADPLYRDRAAGDYRLRPLSPAVDAGVDTGLDVNGPGPGRFEGVAPDLGSEESPYTRP